MRRGSDISTTLKRRRRGKIVNKFYAFFLLLIILSSIVSLLTFVDYFKIKDIDVVGVNNASIEAIKDSVSDMLSGRLFFIFAKDNLFFLPRKQIKETLPSEYKIIDKISLNFLNKNSFQIEIVERNPKALWCRFEYPSIEDCYFIDKTGLLYLQSPNTTANTLLRYYGSVKEDPIGKYFESTDDFKKFYSFNESLKKMNFPIVAFSKYDESEFRSTMNTGTYIILNKQIDLNKALESLESILRESIVKTDKDSISKIKSIDLRFGNKIPLEYND